MSEQDLAGTWRRIIRGDSKSWVVFAHGTGDPVAPGQLYLASGHGEVWHSADYGDSWQRLPVDLGDVWFKLVVSY